MYRKRWSGCQRTPLILLRLKFKVVNTVIMVMLSKQVVYYPPLKTLAIIATGIDNSPKVKTLAIIATGIDNSPKVKTLDYLTPQASGTRQSDPRQPLRRA